MAAAAWGTVLRGLARVGGMFGIGVQHGLQQGIQEETSERVRQALKLVQEAIAKNSSSTTTAATTDAPPVPDPALQAILVEIQGISRGVSELQLAVTRNSLQTAALAGVAVAGATVAAVAIYNKWFR